MFLSIIMPVYNSEQFLNLSIPSVLNQTYPHFELIIINDGSTDNSLKIITEYATKDSRIKFYSQAKSSVAAARNLGLAKAKGNYVSFIDSDDFIEEKTFAVCVEKLNRCPSDLLIYSIRYISKDGAAPPNISPLQDCCYASMEDFMREYIATGVMSIYSNCNKLYRRIIIEQHHIRFMNQMHFGEDRIFNYDFLQKAKSVITLSNQFYWYHLRNNDSLSSRFISNFMSIVLSLHHAKITCVLPYAQSSEKLAPFMVNDLHYEISNAIKHLIQHWKELSPKQRMTECRLIIKTVYPDYFNRGQLIPKSKLL